MAGSEAAATDTTETEGATEAPEVLLGQDKAAPDKADAEESKAETAGDGGEADSGTGSAKKAAPKKAEGDEGKDKDADGKADDQSKEYEPFTLPEGMESDDEGMAAFTEQAQELGLTQEQAQALVTLGAERTQAAIEQYIQAQNEVNAQAWEQWAEETKKDKELGGAKLKENLDTAKRALDHFGSDGLKQLLTESGIGNHPEVIRHFYRVGMTIADDSHVMPGEGGGSNNPDAGLRGLYPTMYEKESA